MDIIALNTVYGLVLKIRISLCPVYNAYISNVTESVQILDFSVVYHKCTTIVLMNAHRFGSFDVYFQANCLE